MLSSAAEMSDLDTLMSSSESRSALDSNGMTFVRADKLPRNSNSEAFGPWSNVSEACKICSWGTYCGASSGELGRLAPHPRQQAY